MSNPLDCPSRSIVANYEVFFQLWDEAKQVVRDTETIARINGVSAYMEKFSFLFGVVLGEVLLGHADNLSKHLKAELAKLTNSQFAPMKCIPCFG